MEKKPTLEELRIAREKLDEQIAAIEVEKKQEVITQVRALVSQAGLTVEDVFGHHGKKTKRHGAPALVKYRHPDGRTWTGVGRKPAWINEALARGESLETFAVSKKKPT